MIATLQMEHSFLKNGLPKLVCVNFYNLFRSTVLTDSLQVFFGTPQGVTNIKS